MKGFKIRHFSQVKTEEVQIADADELDLFDKTSNFIKNPENDFLIQILIAVFLIMAGIIITYLIWRRINPPQKALTKPSKADKKNAVQKILREGRFGQKILAKDDLLTGSELTATTTIIKKPVVVKPIFVKPEDKEKIIEEAQIVSPTINPVKRISYTPSGLHISNELEYPIVKYPKLETVIKFPRIGRSANKGFTEDAFLEYLIKYFKPDFSVYNNHHITQKNNARPYEPDFIIANEKGNKNIFINIEIDEPYDGLNRLPTHIIDQDTYRDSFFVNRGYIVVRFSEIQIHTMPLGCCQFLAEIINSIDATFKTNIEIKKFELTYDKQWDSLQARKWAKEKYREKYLGIKSFGTIAHKENDYKIINNKEDVEVEKNVVETVLVIPKKTKKDLLEKENSNTRDKRITFDAKEHKYYIDKNADTISVSQLIDKFFPEFDAYSAASKLNPRHKYFGIDPSEVVDIWKKEGLEKAVLGTYLHEQIENYYNKKDYDATSQEFQYFLNFENTFPTMIPFRTEWRIFDEELLIAGTIDKIYKRNENSYYMFDWKRSEKVVDAKGDPLKSDPCDSYTEFAAGELSHLTNDSYYKYCLQQNLYRHILETRYNCKISSMNLLILHPSYDNFKWVSIPEMNKEIEYILKISKSRF